MKNTNALPALLRIVQETGSDLLRRQAISALQIYDDPSVGEVIAGVVKDFSAETRLVAFNMLGTRAAWSKSLLHRVRAGEISEGMIPKEAVRKMRRHELLVAEVESVFGPEESLADTEAELLIAKFRAVIESGYGIPAH